MKIHPGVRQILAALTVVLLLALAFQGIAGGAQQFPLSITVAQYVQSAAQVLYGVCAVLAIATTVRWQEYARPVQFGFIAGCVLAGSLAAVSWETRHSARECLPALRHLRSHRRWSGCFGLP